MTKCLDVLSSAMREMRIEMHQSDTYYRLLLFIVYLQGPMEILTKEAVSQQLARRQTCP